jgi:cob(II)yrinic acid a,c-diamide reductase
MAHGLPKLDRPVLKKNEIEPQAYRDAMAHFAGHVHVVTTDGPAGRRGATVIAACSVSDNPPMVLVCLNRENLKNEPFAQNGNFALNTLAAHHQPMAVGFSGVTGLPAEERFALGKWDTLSTGAPTLTDALAVFDCEVVDAKDLATHRVLFGRVAGLRVGDSLRPLIYHGRGYHVLEPATFTEKR